jgi:hypothetical protein
VGGKGGSIAGRWLGGGAGPRTRWLAWIAALTLALAPLLTVTVPPLEDYPSHLARQFILANLDTMPALAANYQIHWAVLPNLAMESVVPALARWLPVTLACQLFLAATLAGLVGGTAALARAVHGRVGLLPLAAPLLLYNLMLLFGSVNFLAGTALLLFALAGWYASRGWPAAARAAAAAAMAAVLFFAHLFAAAVFLLFLGGALLQAWRESHRVPLPEAACLAAAVAAVAGLWSLKPAGLAASDFAFGDAGTRLTGFAGAGIFGLASDGPLLAALVLGLAAAAVAARGNPLTPGLRLPLALLAVAAVVMPRRMLGGDEINLRLPVILPFLALAALPPTLLPTRLERPFLAAVLLLLAARSADVAHDWQTIDRDFAEFRQAARLLPAGARLLTVDDIDDGRRALLYAHLAELAIPQRCVFVPHMAKLPDQQPVLAAAAVQAIDGGTAWPLTLAQLDQGADRDALRLLRSKPQQGAKRMYWADWPDHFDAVLFVHWGRSDPSLRPDLLTPIARGSFFDLYRLRHPPPSRSATCTEDR